MAGELNALQLKKTHANGQNTSKLRKHLDQFDSTCAQNQMDKSAANTHHNQIQKPAPSSTEVCPLETEGFPGDTRKVTKH